MSNMSYCRFTNTLEDLSDCADAVYDPCSAEEHGARVRLLRLAHRMASNFDDDGSFDDEAARSLPTTS